MQAEQLDQLTEAFPECIIAAFADISTNVVLVTSGAQEAPREALNELCAEAALTLGVQDAPALGGEACPMAVKIVDHAVFVYARAGVDPNDAALFMCRPDIEIAPFLAAVKDAAETGGLH